MHLEAEVSRLANLAQRIRDSGPVAPVNCWIEDYTVTRQTGPYHYKRAGLFQGQCRKTKLSSVVISFTRMSLIEHLQQIPEFRAARGQRHELWLVLLLIILGAMIGYWGYRPLAEFAEVYGQEICCKLELAPETKLPSYSTFRRVMQGLDYQVLSSVFTEWAQVQQPIDAGEWFACDGKSIKGSVTHCDQAGQNFVSMVSLFSHQRGVVQAVMPMEHKLVSEQEVVRVLLGAVGLSGIGVTLDALHCQKNTVRDRHARQRLSRVCQSESATTASRD
ncbi:MAG: ISAs1 family transposase [Myxacorys californica WJT36-NPBG1]|nr:ISAs1 family transposase [Myxacorys californica WJT36-NPBG1]